MHHNSNYMYGYGYGPVIATEVPTWVWIVSFVLFIAFLVFIIWRFNKDDTSTA